MCGRFAFYSPAEAAAALFGVETVPAGLALGARYNIAPAEAIPVVRRGRHGEPELVALRWGLVPFWAKDRTIGNRMINARAESLAEKPAFREAFRERRCLVLADGFYEWKAEGGRKTPWFVALEDGRPFALAGVWERWRDRGTGEVLETATIVTTTATGLLAGLHERMPVVFEPEAARRWLDGDPALLGEVTSGMPPAATPAFRAWPVDHKVNDARNEGPELIAEAR